MACLRRDPADSSARELFRSAPDGAVRFVGRIDHRGDAVFELLAGSARVPVITIRAPASSCSVDMANGEHADARTLLMSSMIERGQPPPDELSGAQPRLRLGPDGERLGRGSRRKSTTAHGRETAARIRRRLEDDSWSPSATERARAWRGLAQLRALEQSGAGRGIE